MTATAVWTSFARVSCDEDLLGFSVFLGTAMIVRMMWLTRNVKLFKDNKQEDETDSSSDTNKPHREWLRANGSSRITEGTIQRITEGGTEQRRSAKQPSLLERLWDGATVLFYSSSPRLDSHFDVCPSIFTDTICTTRTFFLLREEESREGSQVSLDPTPHFNLASLSVTPRYS